MDLQEFLDNAVQAERKKVLATSDQKTLGDILAELEPLISKYSDADEQPQVIYDFGYFSPAGIDSWRGAYCEIALNYLDGNYDEVIRLPAFYELIKSAINQHYTGYKGGDFMMTQHTPVWVANNGQACSTAVVGIVDTGYTIIIMTGYREY